MRTLFIGAALCGDQTVQYYLSVKEVGEWEFYGFRVVLGDETAEVSALTVSQKRIQALLDKLVIGSVTPAAARDVVDDWLLL